MNYPFPATSPYIQTAVLQAVQAIMTGGTLLPNGAIMSIPFQQAQQTLPQLMMSLANGGSNLKMFPQPPSYYGSVLYTNNAQPQPILPQQNYNYLVTPYQNNDNNKSKTRQPKQQQHSNIYNSASFDSYVRRLSWSRLFDHHIRKDSNRKNHNQMSMNYDKQPDSSKKWRSDASVTTTLSSSSSTTSDETIRRVNVVSKPASNVNSKQHARSSLPFKYSSEFIPDIGKLQSQNIKSTDIFTIKKP